MVRIHNAHLGPVLPALFLLLLLGSCSSKGQGQFVPGDDTRPRTQKFVLVIVDGLRYSEGLGDPNGTYAPRMQALSRQGTRIEPFLNNGPTITRRAVPAIWSGSWEEPVPFEDPNCSGGENIRAAVPTVFEYFRKHRDLPAEECVYLVGNVGCPWAASLDPDYGAGYWPRYELDGNTDSQRWSLAQDILANEQPDFFLLYLPDVDHAGHGGDWADYESSIRIADGIVGDLWDKLQSLPHYAGVTTMMVTNDHGRHDNRPGEAHGGFSGHGDGCDGCRTIQLLAIGPGIRKGFVSTRPRTIPDIVPTIGFLLGFPTDQASGEPMLEILTNTSAATTQKDR